MDIFLLLGFDLTDTMSECLAVWKFEFSPFLIAPIYIAGISLTCTVVFLLIDAFDYFDYFELA